MNSLVIKDDGDILAVNCDDLDFVDMGDVRVERVSHVEFSRELLWHVRAATMVAPLLSWGFPNRARALQWENEIWAPYVMASKLAQRPISKEAFLKWTSNGHTLNGSRPRSRKASRSRSSRARKT